ncbi:MAG: 2-dehydropantoate 2-reductase [Burkholderiaceae bacterium]|nr:2-dehydropantoate 2-reductase [Burkholderiaceae bacterium]
MFPKKPAVAVVGAGAVGCFFGGLLAKAGLSVTLIARPAHVQAIRKDGLFIDSQGFKGSIPVNATESIADIADAQIVLLSVKSTDTNFTAKMMAPYLHPDARILSLQNGVDNCYRLRQEIDRPAYPAVVYVAVGMDGPGRVKHFGRGELVIGEPDTPGDEAAVADLKNIANVFEAAGIPCNVSLEIKKALWMKFLVNCTYNAISAIGQIEYGCMTQTPEIRQLIERLTDEFLSVALAEDVNISRQEAMSANHSIAVTMPGQRSSTAQDLVRGKLTEINFLNGYIVERARYHSLNVPSHQAVYALVKMIEQHLVAKAIK